MKNETNPQSGANQKPENIHSHKKTNGGPKKGDGKTAGDAAYNAQQLKNDRSRAGRHAGESEMNDENRSGGSGL